MSLNLQGREFTSIKSWLASEGCVLTFKYGINKSNFSEHGIFLVKNRLFKLLRYKLSDDWVKYLPYVVAALNKRSLERIGFLRPDDIHSEYDNIKVQEAQKKNHVEAFSEPDWQTQQKLQQQYEKSSKNKFQVGTYVYVDNPQHVFQKSFHVQVIFFRFQQDSSTCIAVIHLCSTCMEVVHLLCYWLVKKLSLTLRQPISFVLSKLIAIG